MRRRSADWIPPLLPELLQFQHKAVYLLICLRPSWSSWGIITCSTRHSPSEAIPACPSWTCFQHGAWPSWYPGVPLNLNNIVILRSVVLQEQLNSQTLWRLLKVVRNFAPSHGLQHPGIPPSLPLKLSDSTLRLPWSLSHSHRSGYCCSFLQIWLEGRLSVCHRQAHTHTYTHRAH